MPTPTAEQVRTLAPDGAASRAGEALADQRRWSDLGRTEVAAWGLCQGSGATPYQAAVDLAGPAYSCSCPSRKLPCKHALGLLFLLADDRVPAGTAPEWARTWLEGRAARAARSEAPQTKAEVDQAARAKRIESRERKVAAGLDELDRWLADLMRRGLDSARGEGYRFWDAMAARLVDAQAGGLARDVRSLGSAAHGGDAWPHLLLDGAARLHLACSAYRRLDALPEPLVADVRSLVGWTTKEDELRDEDTVRDRWLVLGRRVDDTGQVITARTFLLGETTGRPALHLAFGVDAAPPTVLAVPGQAFRARLAFYPSATPLRAAVRPMVEPDGEVTALPHAIGIEALLRRHAERLAINPFVGRWPEVVGGVVPVLGDGRLRLRDAAGDAVPVSPVSAAAILLAVSGGAPVTVCGTWDGAWLRPLSVLGEDGLVGVSESGDEGILPAPTDEEWARLVSTALLGTERAGDSVAVPPVAAALVADHDRERAVLGAAAVATLRRRAGRTLTADPAPLPEPATPDPRPALTGAAARLVRAVAEERRSLLDEALELVRRSGRRLPHGALPAVLEATATGAASDGGLRSLAAELAGPRALWLAANVPELGELTSLPSTDDPASVFEEAGAARGRADAFAALRRADPDRAREVLAAWLPGSAGEDRAQVVAAMEISLAAPDEPLLAGLLDDRRQDVRRTAAELLVRLPGSQFVATIERIARPLLTETGRFRRSMSVRLPEADPAVDVASFAGKPPQGWGEKAWHLRWLVGHVAPSRWTEWLGSQPRDLVHRALATDEARPVLAGWMRAAGLFVDADMTAALLADPKALDAAEAHPEALLAPLPPSARASVAAATASTLEPGALAAAAEAVPPPWPPALARRALELIEQTSNVPWPDQTVYVLARAAAAGLDPSDAEAFEHAVAHDGRVRPSLEDAVELIRFRARLHDAFAVLPPVAAEVPR